MQITILRGTREIGGTCIEGAYSGTRLILDLGMPLMNRDGGDLDLQTIQNPTVANGILPNIQGLYAGDAPSIDAVLLSHPHQRPRIPRGSTKTGDGFEAQNIDSDSYLVW